MCGPSENCLIIGSKGIAAYADHAAILGHEKDDIYGFLMEALASTTKELSTDEMIAMVMKAGDCAVNTMALLDEANTNAYGNPEITEVNIGVGKNPGILISGHDLKDIGGVAQNRPRERGWTFTTHGEMLPGQLLPGLQEIRPFCGQLRRIVVAPEQGFRNLQRRHRADHQLPHPRSKRKTLIWTGSSPPAWSTIPVPRHIAKRPAGGAKDFSAVIERAKQCAPPQEIESGKIVGGFAHNQVLALADKVIDAVKSGAIKRFVVMAGCDGRQKSRSYFTEVAENLPKDTVILTGRLRQVPLQQAEPGRHRRHSPRTGCRPVQRFLFPGCDRPEAQGSVRPE